MDSSDYHFRLFIAGDEPNSRLAEENLRSLCLKHLAGRHHIEVIDVIENFEAALAMQVLVAPAVVVDSPRRVTLFGALTDEATVLAALGLTEGQHGS